MLNVTTWTPINFFKTREFRESSPDSLFKDNFINLLVIYVDLWPNLDENRLWLPF